MVTLYQTMISSLILAMSLRSAPIQASQKTTKVVIGYVQDWDGIGFVPEQLDLEKITHLDVAFANPVDDTGILSTTPHLDQLVSLCHKKKVKALVSIGGGGISEDKVARDRYFALTSDAKRKSFVASLTQYIVDHKLDGIDVDLEGPAIGKDYGSFVSDLAASLRAKKKLITAAVSMGYGGDQIPATALATFDFVCAMAYDATGPWNPNQAGQHSSFDLVKDNTTYWLGRGVAKEKLVMGVPFYGYGFGESFTKDGYTYAQIVSQFAGAETSDQVAKTIYYNGIPTIQAKTKYVVDQGLGGVMIWSIDQDAKGKLSLLSAIYETLHAKS